MSRFREASDIFTVHICKTCCTLVDTANSKLNFFWCKICQSREMVREIDLPFTFLVLMLELQATSVVIKLVIEDDDVVNIEAL